MNKKAISRGLIAAGLVVAGISLFHLSAINKDLASIKREEALVNPKKPDTTSLPPRYAWTNEDRDRGYTTVYYYPIGGDPEWIADTMAIHSPFEDSGVETHCFANGSRISRTIYVTVKEALDDSIRCAWNDYKERHPVIKQTTHGCGDVNIVGDGNSVGARICTSGINSPVVGTNTGSITVTSDGTCTVNGQPCTSGDAVATGNGIVANTGHHANILVIGSRP